MATEVVHPSGGYPTGSPLSGPTAGLDAPRQAPWHVLWTHSHCEQMVYEQLAARGFHPFLPRVDMWSFRAGARRLVKAPMFPGYLFLNEALDKAAHIEVRKARGLVRLLGDRWDRPAVVPESEMTAVRQVAASRVPAFPHPYLHEGRRVRIVSGPLADLEGVLVKVRPEKGLLVLSVHLLQRSVAVEVDGTQVVPA
ncbi:MAG: NusG-like protein [Acidobacteria bacterium]|nr:MAG: NusG-like protein [Acidobacteriota bacterium]